jgi:hypothetical protein
MMSRPNLCGLSTIAVVGFSLLLGNAIAQQVPSARTDYDVVILNDRVMDPESGLDAIRNVGIRGGKIETVSADSLQVTRHSMRMDLSYRRDSSTCTSMVRMRRTTPSRSLTALRQRSNLRWVWMI